MKHIKVLSQELINQIAAGEVIERPAALIKEVIENSIDAKANTISIELENSGFDSIIITDNGDGIDKEDLPYIPLRHTTSKISNFDDLYNISTLGFRGEALASIFSISKTTIQSKYKESEYAYQISNEHLGENTENNKNKTEYIVKKTSHPNGTTITIKDLFYNVPARLKYLKTHSIELKSILEMVKKILLIHPHLNLTLKNNSKILIQKPYFSSLEENIKSVLSIQQDSDFFEINHSTHHLILSGYLAHTNQLTYSTNKYCYVYVNSRPIESKLIHKAIMNGISTNIALGRFPLYVLHITIDPQLIDVNIHPSKKEIKFEQEHIIYETISKTIENIFSSQLLFKENTSNKNFQNLKVNKTLTNESERVTSKVVKQYQKPNYYSNSIQKELNSQLKPELNEDHKLDYSSIEELELENELKQTIQTPRIVKDEVNNITPTYGPLYEYLKEYRIIGQLHKTYILIETLKGLLIVDQHVAEEKFYYELFKQQFTSSQKSSQYLIEPKIKTITQEQVILFEENSTYFSNLGFEIDLISDTQIAIRKVPLDLKGKTIEPDLILDLIDSLQDFSKSSLSLEEYLIEHFSILSCKSSIRAGDELSFSTMKSIIEQLKVLKEPFNCPHGRPIIVEYSTHDLEKMFNRH